MFICLNTPNSNKVLTLETMIENAPENYFPSDRGSFVKH